MAPDLKTAPFMLHPRLRWLEFRRALLFALLGGTLGGVMLIYAASELYRAERVQQVWRQGEPGTRCRMLTMRRSHDHSHLVQWVHLEVSYESSDHQVHQTHARLTRFLVAPDADEPIEVRYERSAPDSAVTSWECDSIWHVVGFVGLSLALSGLLGWSAVREVHRARRRVSHAEVLAREGRLARVKILNSARNESGFRVTTHYCYETPRGTVLEEDLAVAEGGAFRLGADPACSLALLSYDEREGLLLTRGGYPLAKETFG